MALGGGRKQQQQQQQKQNPLDQKCQRQELEQRQRQQQQKQQESSSDEDEEEEFDEEDIFGDGDEGFVGGGLTEDQMMQMMMKSHQGRKMLGGRGVAKGGDDDDEDDEFDGIEDFPMMDDEGDDGFDYDGFDDEEDDEEGDFDDEDRIQVLETSSDDEGDVDQGKKKNSKANKDKKSNNNNNNNKKQQVVDENPLDAADINVNFSVDNMVEEDVPKVASHLEHYFPDPEKATVDLDAFAKLIFNKGVGTSVVLAQQEQGDDEDDDEEESDDDDAKKKKVNLDNDEDPEQQFYGVLSLLSANTISQNGALSKSIKSLESTLFKEVLAKLSSPTAVHPIALLTSAGSRSALVVSELFSQLPPQLIARLYSCFVEETEASPKSVPQHVIFLSKVAPATAKSAEDKTPLAASAESARKYTNEKANSKNQPKKRGPRAEEEDEETAENGGEFATFQRFEEDLFYRNRDSVNTLVARGRFNNDTVDPRRCLCYAVSWKKFKDAVAELSILIQ